MNNLLALPEVQSGVVPFVVAALVFFLARPLRGSWAGLGLAAGFYAAVYLIAGFDLMPLTSTRKVLLLGLGATLVGLLLDALPRPGRYLIPVLFVVAGAGALWVVWPLLLRREGPELWLLAGGALTYAGWMAAWSEGVRGDPVRGASAVVLLGIGTGGSAVLGASILLGQLAVALAVAGGVFWLAALALRHTPTGSTFSLPALLLLGLIGLAGAVFAKIPWYSLLSLALIPPLACIPLGSTWPRWGRVLLLSAISLAPAVLAIVLAWPSESASLY